MEDFDLDLESPPAAVGNGRNIVSNADRDMPSIPTVMPISLKHSSDPATA